MNAVDPDLPCRVMVTRACPDPDVYDCGHDPDLPCARFELTQEQADPIWDASDGIPDRRG